MLWYKAWRESSVRFLVVAAVIAAICLARVLFEQRFFPDIAREAPHVHNYLQYLYWTIFAGSARGLLQLCCLLLGLGGLQRDRKQNSLSFTLALPVSRPRLVVTRALVGFLEIFILSLLPPFLLWATSPLVHQSMPLSYGLGFVPYWTIGGWFTFGVAFLCSVIFTSEYTALAVGYLSYVFYLAICRHPRLSPYPLHAADFMSGRLDHVLDPHTLLWTGAVPVTLIAGFTLAAMILVAASTFITTRQDL
jgi:ABC-type transport system involved in multi-copper enzyme maturation permease subunit